MLERICKPASVDDLLAKLDEHEKKTGKKSVVVEVQNKALGGCYDVIPQDPTPELLKWHGGDIYLGILTREDLLKMQNCLKDARYAAKDAKHDFVLCALASVKNMEKKSCPQVDQWHHAPWGQYMHICDYAPHKSLTTLPKADEIRPEELIKRAEKK